MDAKRRIEKLENMLPPIIKLTDEKRLEIIAGIIKAYEEGCCPLSEENKARLIRYREEYKNMTSQSRSSQKT